jgi:dienelactone hydrolase
MTVKEETIDDVLAAVTWLRSRQGIDPSRVFVLGHSLGGMLAPRIAAASADARGFIVMAGAVRSLEQSLVDQTRYLIEADGQVAPVEKQQLDEMEKIAAAVRALTNADLRSSRPVGGVPASYWADLRGYDPPAAARAITRPLLVLQGERDYQVTMADFARWREALSGRPNVTLRSYPALNHLFMPGKGPSLPAEYTSPAHVDPQVIDDIAGWIQKAGQP